jgi:hypothetical protein
MVSKGSNDVDGGSAGIPIRPNCGDRQLPNPLVPGNARSLTQALRIDLIRDSVITFAELARRLPHRRNGRPTHVGTIHRWRLRGLRGVKLTATRVGSVWVTTMEMYQAFCDALTNASEGKFASTASTRVSSETDQLLDKHGL